MRSLVPDLSEAKRGYKSQSRLAGESGYTTNNYRPLKLIYYEAYLYKKDAVARELYLKTGDGRHEIRKQLKCLLVVEIGNSQ